MVREYLRRAVETARGVFEDSCGEGIKTYRRWLGIKSLQDCLINLERK